ncbi:fused MFS/spermidine synthase [Schlesneria sp. DSM 10557]|uniref:fused MFS/spermidine synthase n=1 Tax=Schlesneria sp. DSM 10557 TaxID=3044399 RepID=UPI0035A00EB2
MSSPSTSGEPGPENEPELTYRLATESPIPKGEIQPPPPVELPTPRKFAKPKPSNVMEMMGFNALVFVTSVCVMTLELTASRLIGKHVGSSLYTWTSVIGVVLAGITFGNWLGGWMADRFDRKRALAWMYLLGSVSCGNVLWLEQIVGTIPRPDSFSWPAWIVTVVALIFLLPALALGATSPLVASMAIDRSTKTGSTVGNVYAWGAMGSIVGTFLTGFYLIDVWGTRSIIGLTATTLAVLAVIVVGAGRGFRTAVLLGWLQLLGWTMLFATCDNSAMGSVGLTVGKCLTMTKPRLEAASAQESWLEYGRYVGEKFHEVGLLLRLRDDPLNKYHDESNYFDILVNDTVVNERPVKMLKLDKLIHSYYDPGNPTSLHYEYERIYAAVTKRAAAPPTFESLSLPLKGLEGLNLSPAVLPEDVHLDETGQLLKIAKPTMGVFEKLLALAPEAEYWKAIEWLHTETNKPLWGGFSSVNLKGLPEGIILPPEFNAILRHDESLEVLIAYEPISHAALDQLIALTPSAEWYNEITRLIRESRRSSACFYGGGGFIFPRWFLKEFPGSAHIDVAELDPAVHYAVTQEMGLTPELEQRIRTIIGDARNFVDDSLRANRERASRSEPPVTYDFIYADAFNDFSIPWHLTTREFQQKTYELLNERGVFQANIIDIYPRTEYPGRTVDEAEADYQGRLPIGVLRDEPKRDKYIPATKRFAPLEVMELLSNRYRLRVQRPPTAHEESFLKDAFWEAIKPATEFEISKGFQPEIKIEEERSGWNRAINQLMTQSRKRLPFAGKLPAQLEPANQEQQTWTPSPAPFEFVETLRTDADQRVLGFRGIITPEIAQQLIELDPGNPPWAQAVKSVAERSRQKIAGRFLGRYVATAASVFPNVYVFSTSYQQPSASRDTFVMVCSRQPIDLKSLDDTGDWTGGPFASLETPPGSNERILSGQMSAVLALSEGQILTDDFAPVDNLLVPVFTSQE